MCFATSPKINAPTPPPPPVDTGDPNSPEAKKAAAARSRQAALARGFTSTIMTGPQGDLSAAPVQRKELLGS